MIDMHVRYIKMMLHDSNCCSWASKSKELLFHFNFIGVWEESDNNWLINIDSSNRYSVYKIYKQFR